jgi:hypothetical protein
MRFLSPVKHDAPRRARIVAALAYLDYLGLGVADLIGQENRELCDFQVEAVAGDCSTEPRGS